MLYGTHLLRYSTLQAIESFRGTLQIIKSDREGRDNAYMIIIIALLIGYLITHAAYKHGINKAYSH